ncbi:DUF6261 family protein [Tenacibaculum sp. TC6]|uniref:DUF6261 family protein n=1 Tax=Tenacibaculum sp. TC6 TaxID=3423223 RepID=UPI003D35B5EE
MISPYLTRYRHGEYLQYMKDVLELVKAQDVDVLLLTEPTQSLTLKTAKIEAAYKQQAGSELSQELVDLDTVRDRTIVGIRFVVEGYTYHFDESKAAAAQKLLKAIEVYGTSIARKNYQEETASLDNLVRDIETRQTLQEATTVLAITDWFAKLKLENTAFSQKYIERVGDVAENPFESIPEYRIEASEAFRALIAHIEAHKVLSANDAYAKLLDKLAVLTTQYNQLIDNRTTTGGTTPTEPTEEAL